MVNCIRTNSANEIFQNLVGKLDGELKVIDGADHIFYSPYNKIDKIKFAVIAFENGVPVGCGAIREYSTGVLEVKRMYVLPAARNQGIASTILKELEGWGIELGGSRLLLETGKNQPEAIALYHKSGYQVIPNFGQYEHIANSVCFEKLLPGKI